VTAKAGLLTTEDRRLPTRNKNAGLVGPAFSRLYTVGERLVSGDPRDLFGHRL